MCARAHIYTELSNNKFYCCSDHCCVNCITKQSRFDMRIVATYMYVLHINLIPINQWLSNVVRLITSDRTRGQLRNLLMGRVNVRFALNRKMRVIARKFD